MMNIFRFANPLSCSFLYLLGTLALLVGCNSPSTDEANSDAASTEVGQQVFDRTEEVLIQPPKVKLATAASDKDSGYEGNWNQFRGPNGYGHSPMSDTPTTWAEGKNLAWKTKLFGRGASMPVVWGDRVFVTSYSGYGLEAGKPANKANLRLHLICLDRTTGEPVWQRTVKGSLAAQHPSENYLRHGSASSTPYCDGERVYVSFGVNGLYAFDMQGELAWKASLGPLTDNFGSSASPIVFEDLLIINASIENKRLIAFEKTTGRTKWVWNGANEEGINRTWSMPVVGKSADGRDELVFNQWHRISGLDPRTGDELWHCEGIPDYVISHPIIHNDVAYCSGGKQSKLIAVRLGGNGEVTKTHKLWESKGIANVPTPIVFNDSLYVVGENSILQQFDMATGKPGKKRRVKCKGRVFSSLVMSKDLFYVAAPTKGISVIDPNQDFKVVASNLVDADASDTLSCCAIADDQLFYRNEDWVYCVQTLSAKTRLNDARPDESLGLVAPPAMFEIDGKGKHKVYVRYHATDRAGTNELVLTPYKPVITPGAEKTALLGVVDSYWDKYQQIRKDLNALLLKQNHLPENEYVASFTEIEKRTVRLDREVRKDVKSRFSAAQMAQHKQDQADWVKAQEAKKKAKKLR